MANKSLFEDFKAVSAKEWKQKIQYDLKGADYNETLIWESLEGIHVKPFYSAEDSQNTHSFDLPKYHTWQIGHPIYTANLDKANRKAIAVLNSGVQSLLFKIPKAITSWQSLLRDIDLKQTSLHFSFEHLDMKTIRSLMDFIGNDEIKIFLNIDILGNLNRTGNWYKSVKEDHELLSEITNLCKEKKGVHLLSVDMGLYQNSGANMVQQLAYGLAHGNEYLNHLEKKNLPIPTIIQFKVAVGSNYFFEIAKLKALRWLWQSLGRVYDHKIDCHILAIPSKRNKTLYDYNVNMLRTTSECMSAVLGGANTIINLPYDALYNKENEFGDRIARNQLLLLKEESYFDQGVHAANGTYYLEALTNQLAEKALLLFKQIEASGGFYKQIKEGVIQKKIKESAKKEQQKFDSGELILLGTNKFQNKGDKMKENLHLFPFVKTEKRKTLIEPIIANRLAEALEKIRLDNE
ncbi:MAG: methylmalonyl-CoA mutase subunit beta [Croceitalea sp.]|nr:methylmalonyl-CoA mutase subunit beta [Croceitalea sp.]